jgi:uncharacterized membrane protein YiaA
MDRKEINNRIDDICINTLKIVIIIGIIGIFIGLFNMSIS